MRSHSHSLISKQSPAQTQQAIFHAGQPVPEAGATVCLGFDPRRAHLFDGETGARLAAELVAHRAEGATGGLEHRA